MCQLNDGSIVVAWSDMNQNQAMIKHYAPNLDVLKGETTIGALSTGNIPYPQISALSDGGFVAIWQIDDGIDLGIGGLIFNSNANTNGTMFDVHVGTMNERRFYSVAGLVNGGFVTVFEEKAANTDCYY